MPATPEIMRTPKAYWQTRRSEGHSDWSFGFWRELFQNSVDAGAKRIDITVGNAAGKGSFGRDATVDDVVRVTFRDDGQGMDERVLRQVFLKPGETTKKGGDFQGGFGTARIMLAFSQVRYGIDTQNWIVEGDGSEYTVLTAVEAVEAKRAEIAAAVEEGNQAKDLQLRADLASLEARPETVQGTRFEIDIDPQEFPYRWKNVDAEKLLSKLNDYLSMSQLPCKVFLNGDEVMARTLKGPARRKLVAQGPDGQEVEFASIHTSQGERAKFKGQLVVRAGGAAMYLEDVQAREQVILELDPKVARNALTDNRDGMKEPYRTAVNAFLRELAVDVKSAIEDKDRRRHIKVEGGRGALIARLGGVLPAVEVEGEISRGSDKAPKARYTTQEDYELKGFGGAPAKAVNVLLEAIGRGEETFLTRAAADVGMAAEGEAFEAAVRAGRGAEALAELGEELGAAVAGTLTARITAAEAAERARYADMNDVHIQIDDIGNDEKLKNAVRRHSPGYWRKQGEHLEGRGMQAHMLLAAWTACCQEAVEALIAQRPEAARNGELAYSTGFYFGKPTRSWNRYTGDYEDRRTNAQHQERDGVHLLLLNPVNADGSSAYDLSLARRDPADRSGVGALQDLEALAVHEVSHMLESYHDEDFASLMTRVAATFNRARAHERMRDAVDAVRAAYGRGKTRIQAMQGEDTVVVLEAEEPEATPKGRRKAPRPSEVLLAHSAPIATMLAGAASARENAHLAADALKHAVAGAVTVGEGGVTEVDCDKLQSLETRMTELADNDWKLDISSLDLPPAEELIELGAPEPKEVANEPISSDRVETVAPVPASFDLSTLDLPSAGDLQELGAPSPDGNEAIAQQAPRPSKTAPMPLGPAKVVAEAPMAQPSEADAPARPAATNGAAAALRGLSAQLAALAPSSAPKEAPQLAVQVLPPAPTPRPKTDARPVRRLVADDFDMEGFEEEAPAPAFR